MEKYPVLTVSCFVLLVIQSTCVLVLTIWHVWRDRKEAHATLVIEPQFLKQMMRMADGLGCSLSQLASLGLSTYFYLMREGETGAQIMVVYPDGSEVEVALYANPNNEHKTPIVPDGPRPKKEGTDL